MINEQNFNRTVPYSLHLSKYRIERQEKEDNRTHAGGISEDYRRSTMNPHGSLNTRERERRFEEEEKKHRSNANKNYDIPYKIPESLSKTNFSRATQQKLTRNIEMLSSDSEGIPQTSFK